MSASARLILCADADQPKNRVRLESCKVTLSQGEPPEWIMLVPGGEDVRALDGRRFSNTKPKSVLRRFKKDPRDLVLDWEHSTEMKAWRGDKAPAAGWITQLRIDDDGHIMGRVEWTEKGAKSVSSRAYRYVSPAFLTDLKTNEVTELVSAGLTNRPALNMPALAQDGGAKTSGAEHRTTPESEMDPKLLALLGLDAKATAEQVLEACTQLKVNEEKFRLGAEKVSSEMAGLRDELKTAREAKPSLDKFVPRADYDVMTARAETAENKAKEEAAAMRAEKIDAAIEAARKAGKITPATESYYRDQCAEEGGLEKFAAFVKAAPAIGDPTTNLDKKPDEPAKGPRKPTAEEIEVARACGVTEEVLAKSLQ